ncbi:MAG TPA: IS4 family transposase, partial [Longimicrobium sp.]|nr:IS4 family transposase [Longimicrobium sp.]
FGGFQGRKGDGDPGVKAIWQGWRRLMDFVLAARALTRG